MASTIVSKEREINVAPRAAVCVIANEVLTGKTLDTNSNFIAKFLFERGVDLVRIAVIPDELDVIASTVKEFSDLVGQSGYVFTTGGIGPTHDDITYEGVAKAFDVGVELHEPTVEKLKLEVKTKYNRDISFNDEVLRMATLPVGCAILETGSWVPLVVVHNVYILPGVPSIMHDMLTFNADRFVGVPIHCITVYTMQLEGHSAKNVKAIQKQHPRLSIGCYINQENITMGMSAVAYNTRVTVEGRDYQEVDQVAQELELAIEGFRTLPTANNALSS